MGPTSPESTPSRTLILGTAGHIDHGKTALVHALTGVDTDRLPEEQQRGMTIDIGFAKLDLGEFEIGIVDVPGHERFIRNMLAGSTGNDLAILVVAADDSIMPQTREHLEILKLLDVRQGVIAITKCDLVNAEFLDLVEQEVRQFVAGSFLQSAPIVRTSATTGWGIAELKSALGKVLRRFESRPHGCLFRLAVDRSFAARGEGTIVTGSVASGRVRIGDEVEWLPTGKTVRVRSIESHGQNVGVAHRGQRAAIGLVGVHHRQIMRNHELATTGYLKPTRIMTAKLSVAQSSPWPVKHRTKIRLHLGTSQIVATVSLLRGNVLTGGESTTVQFFLAESTTATCGQPFVVRSLSPLATLGGGHILQPLAKYISRRHVQNLDRVEACGSSDAKERVTAALFTYGIESWTGLDLCRDANIELNQMPPILDLLVQDRALIELRIGPRRTALLHPDILASWERRIIEVLRRHHAKQPLQVGLPQRILANQVRLDEDKTLLAALLARLADAQRVAPHGDAVALADFAPKLSEEQQILYDKIIAQYRAAGFHPPTPVELAAHRHVPEPVVRKITELAVARGDLKHLGGALYLHAVKERQMCHRIGQQLKNSSGLTISEIRTLLETSRKFAVPFCEYLDRIGITRRRGNLRVLTNDDTVDLFTTSDGEQNST